MNKQSIFKRVILLIVLTLSFNQVVLAITPDELLPKMGEKAGSETLKKYPEITTVSNLPKLSDTELFMNIIKLILSWSMLITLVALVAAAIYYLISRGKEEDITKAKDIILYLVIGMGIMAAAYGIVAGITQFRFFD